jgi:hypothetical protein
MTDLPPALSVRQPWAFAIVHLRKDIENRDQRVGYRGPLLIHASAGMTVIEYECAQAFMHSRGLLGGLLPVRGRLERGGIIGIVDLVDCVETHPSRWFVGDFGLVLTNPRPLPLIECKGTVFPKVWEVPEAVRPRVRYELAKLEHRAA